MRPDTLISQFERQFDPYTVRVLPDKSVALATIHSDGKITVHFKVLGKDSEPKLRIGYGMPWHYSTQMLTDFFKVSEKILKYLENSSQKEKK
ncbi:MAG: hypothetical protein J0L60_06695 [Ignavibacteria bacterium]|nr:hypothetical protein [Ignavibacteria bacterium]